MNSRPDSWWPDVTFTVIVLAVLLLLGVVIASGGDEPARRSEREWCVVLAPKYGVPPEDVEVTLPDETRADLVGAERVYEVDWAPKWAEGIGQAVYYSIWTGKRPAVILLTDDPRRDKLHILRAQLACQRAGVELFVERIGEQ